MKTKEVKVIEFHTITSIGGERVVSRVHFIASIGGARVVSHVHVITRIGGGGGRGWCLMYML